MIFRQLFDAASSTYTYLLADEQTHEGVLVDPVFEQHARDAALVRELGVKLAMTIDTHCHADHVTGAWLMRRALGSRIALSPAYGATNIDVAMQHGDELRFGDHVIDVRATPGHTSGCTSLVVRDHDIVFTGDALLVRGAGRTDFQSGDPEVLFYSITDQLFTLPGATTIYPAHDYEGRTSSTIGEEKRFNPRIGGRARVEDFVGYMKNLGLPHPKQLAIALPANLRAGEPEGGNMPPAAPDWGPLVTTYAGILEVEPEWVARHREEITLVDVRSAAEWSGELGHIGGSILVPLDELRARAVEVAKDKPVVVTCQTGKRSAMATVILRKAGFDRVANLAGGVVRWRELGLP
jgi:glyoxylase-like metal-dependent hydrolase (beta-lactamase superfamily II)/rhodanese-related sulfurtransferase